MAPPVIEDPAKKVQQYAAGSTAQLVPPAAVRAESLQSLHSSIGMHLLENFDSIVARQVNTLSINAWELCGMKKLGRGNELFGVGKGLKLKILSFLGDEDMFDDEVDTLFAEKIQKQQKQDHEKRCKAVLRKIKREITKAVQADHCTKSKCFWWRADALDTAAYPTGAQTPSDACVGSGNETFFDFSDMRMIRMIEQTGLTVAWNGIYDGGYLLEIEW